MHRRGFLGSLLGLLGLGGVAKASQKESFEQLLDRMRKMPPGRWSDDHLQVITQQLWKHKADRICVPNPEQTLVDLFNQVGDQMEQTGLGLIWAVPDINGKVCALYCIPTFLAVAYPASSPDYPDGYYKILSFFSDGSWQLTHVASAGVAIPSTQIIRCKARNYRTHWHSMMQQVDPSVVISFDK